jgi:hypothetical protein
MAGRSLVITLSVVTESQANATRAAESFARLATGLVLDGIDVSLSLLELEADDDELEEP